MAPRELTPPLHSLPPILDSESQTPTSSCSKGSRGLSVQPRVLGIFTETTISPDPSKRQRPSRYAIRAGRNLPDKEFRWFLIHAYIEFGRVNGTTLPLMSFPACRHAVGTISWPSVEGLWRIVSEDSQDFRWLSMIHRLCDLGYFNQAGDREVLALLHQTKHLDKLREVNSL